MVETNRSGDAVSRTGGYRGFLTAILSDRERFFADLVADDRSPQKLTYAFVTVITLSALYGLVAGSYSGWPQAISSAIKLPLLFLATFVICFPVFFIVQILVGSRLRLRQVVVLVMSALALTSILLAGFVPIVLFFLITGSNYYFLQLLHVVIVLVAGGLGMYALHEALSLVCEKRGVYPRKAMTIMRLWAILFAFVGVQMAWNLRPFLGDRQEPFQVFRDYEGNYYAAVVYSVNKLMKGEDQSSGTESVPRAPYSTEELKEIVAPDSVSAPGVQDE